MKQEQIKAGVWYFIPDQDLNSIVKFKEDGKNEVIEQVFESGNYFVSGHDYVTEETREATTNEIIDFQEIKKNKGKLITT